jgi:uncharacterized membrane protein YbhN (UPF0104 family)
MRKTCSTTMSNVARRGAGAAVSARSVVHSVAGMNELWATITGAFEVLEHARPGFVLAAFAVDTAALVIMALRWQILLRSLGSGTTLWEALLAYSSGVCVCNVTPARTVGGDACRAALIPRPGGSPPLKSIAASVFYDRLTDVAGILLLTVLALPVILPRSSHRTGLVLLALVGTVVVARPLLRRIVSRLTQRHQVLVELTPRRSLAAAIGCSLAIWLLDITRVMLIAAALGVAFAPSQAATVSLLRLGSGAVPVPAGIGVVDAALVGGFMWLGQPPPTAAAMAAVERIIVYGWGTALGAVALVLVGGRRVLQKSRANDFEPGTGEP